MSEPVKAPPGHISNYLEAERDKAAKGVVCSSMEPRDAWDLAWEYAVEAERKRCIAVLSNWIEMSDCDREIWACQQCLETILEAKP
jgi:hypothetical protein